jgi:tetratricopeptide (TPR) repeat protein
MGEYSKVPSFYEKAFEIQQKTLPPNHPNLAISYSNIAAVCYNMGEYPKALSYFERTLNMFQISLPSNHPNIQAIQENIEVLEKKL